MKEVNIKTDTPFNKKEISVVKDSIGEYNFILKNLVTDEKLGVTLSRSELKTLIVGLMAMGNFNEDAFKEKSYRYTLSEFFVEPSSPKRFLYQNISGGNVFLESEEKFDNLFSNKDNYKNMFTDREFASLLENNPELSVLIKDKEFDIG